MYWHLNFLRSFVLRIVVLTALLVSVSACDGTLSNTATVDHDEVDAASGNSVNDFTLPMPAGFTGLRSVIISNLYAIVSIDGFEPLRFEAGDQLSASFNVARGDTFTGTIEWFETLPSNFELLLASYDIRETVEESLPLTIDRFAYETEGEGFDEDNDGFSNLRERSADSNPLNAGETPESTPNVRITGIDAPDPEIVIDGFYDRIYSDSATFNDVAGETLSIDNLMIDQGAIRADGNTEFQWLALHDGIFLYVYVLGESAEIGTPVRDSTEFFRDDSIDIFIDANNSKGSSYDGIDDRHMIIPLITSPGDTSISNTTAITAGPNSASLPPVEFATCVCNDQFTWEVKIPLAEFGIQIDTPFGFEVQLNNDDDGGERDSKWGWFHPSRTTEDVDNTFAIPSFMGTAVLN